MNVSFQPDGLYFVFDEQTGKTLRRDIPTKGQATFWIAKMARDKDHSAQQSASQ